MIPSLVYIYFNLGFLNEWRWKVDFGERKRSSFQWLAAQTRQTVHNLNSSLPITSQRVLDVLRLLQKKAKKINFSRCVREPRCVHLCPHHMIKWVWGFSRLRRVQHQIQGNLAQHRCTGVCWEHCEDVFHNSGVQIYQLHVSSAQTTSGGKRKESNQ